MGWQHIENSLREPRTDGVAKIIPFLTAGFPDPKTTIELVSVLEESGAAAVELGVPFSDPLADGTTIQKTSFESLKQGMTLRGCLELCSTLRASGVRLPIILMGYYNPLLSYGLEKISNDASDAGVDGLIVADLPHEEGGPLRQACDLNQIAVVPLIAPTSSEQRLQSVCSDARGFVYCVSLVGVTGVRSEIPEEVSVFLNRVRVHAQAPLAVGFGISRGDQVKAMSKFADAVVVGSALLEVIAGASHAERPRAVQRFMGELTGPDRT